jgi:hypothetical protein
MYMKCQNKVHVKIQILKEIENSSIVHNLTRCQESIERRQEVYEVPGKSYLIALR